MSKLEYHYEIMGRILTYLVNNGLSKLMIDDNVMRRVLPDIVEDDEVALQTFADVMEWMQREGLISVGKVARYYSGGFAFSGVQLTSKGIAIVKSETSDGQTVVSKISGKNPNDPNSAFFTQIGDLVGGLLGGFTKSLAG